MIKKPIADSSKHHVFLLLGGNMGDVILHFEKAKMLLSEELGQVTQVSPVYCSESWGFKSENMFYNQVVELHTSFSPHALLKSILAIEQTLGRKRPDTKMSDPSRMPSYGSRPIDIDILFYDHLILDSVDLSIPHPRLHHRNFTLVPMHDLAPLYVHPALKKSIAELLAQSPDPSEVHLLVQSEKSVQ